MQNHGFFIALAYGVSVVLLVLEVWLLWQRCRRQRSDLESSV